MINSIIMIELLILYILFAQKNTQYGIRKNIKEKFFYLTSSSFGTIHPAISRLLSKDFLTEEKTISAGGRRRNIYEITDKGKEYLIDSLKADFSLNTPNLDKMINTKLVCSDVLEVSYRKMLYVKAVRYYEAQILMMQRTLKKSQLNEFQLSQLRNLISSFDSKKTWLEGLL